MFLVGLTRVRDIEHLRFMPLQPGHSLEHLTKLAPNPRMLAFLAGYNEKGEWIPDKTKDTLHLISTHQDASSPPSKKRKTKTPTTTPKRPRPPQADPSPPPNKAKRPAANDPKSFQLNGLAGTFRSFDNPGAGSCLFHAFKASVNCTESHTTMRRNLISHIATIQDSCTRIVHMHQFFPDCTLQLHDFDTPAFHSKWNEYKKRMSRTNEWCGFFEVMQLGIMYNKSVVVWRKSVSDAPNSFAEIIDRHILPDAQVLNLLFSTFLLPVTVLSVPLQHDVVHLLYLNDNHFEHTNIPPTFLPPDHQGILHFLTRPSFL